MSPPSSSLPLPGLGSDHDDGSDTSNMRLPALNNAGHVAHCVRCLDGLPASLVEIDASRYVQFLFSTHLYSDPFFLRMAIAFYCLGTLDVTGMAERQISPTDRKSWKEWIWDQYVGKQEILLHTRLIAFGCSFLSSYWRGNRRRLSPWSVCESERERW